ncbi:MAG: hypothetical protein ACP5QK_04905 [Myxococcota bacterium]
MRVLLLSAILLAAFACPSPNYVPTEYQYSEYQCPEPIGLIVRENCRENVIKYQAEDLNVNAKVSATQIATAEGSYKSETKVLQEASEFMQFLKDQQVSLCNDYNTCKLTTQEYKERKDRINKTFTTVYALTKQIKVSDLDPETRKDILKKILAAIDEYNKPLSKPPEPAGHHKIQFKPAPARVNSYEQPQNTGTINSNPATAPGSTQSGEPDINESLDEAGKVMMNMQKKAIEIQKKAIKMQKEFENNAEEGGEDY